jgi:hypothetical protein
MKFSTNELWWIHPGYCSWLLVDGELSEVGMFTLETLRYARVTE